MGGCDEVGGVAWDRDFDMTPDEFDRALADCSRARDERSVQAFPPAKKGRGNPNLVLPGAKGDKEQ